MKKLLAPLLALLILYGCTAAPEETVPTETIPETTEHVSIPETVPPTTVPPTTEVTEPVLDQSWFDDALFIGESRTMGLKLRARLGKADYFCGEGLTVYGVMGVKASDDNFAEQSLHSLFSWRQYGKIYIHLGINELGGNLDNYVVRYQAVIDEIRALQPDACIILQSVLALGEGYSTKPWFSRESIQDINNRIRTLAEENGLFYSDVNQILTNEEGYLIKEMTFDGCHLYPAGYEAWAKWLLEEAATFDIP